MEPTVFISYSRKDKSFLDLLTPFLLSAPRVARVLWYDEHKIEYGDKFDESIRQALERSRVGILLISPNFFTSDYIKFTELPFLIERAKRGVLSLGIVYLTATPRAALEIEGINFFETYHSVTTPDKPLESLEPSVQSAKLAKLADWVVSKLPTASPSPVMHRSGERHQLALRLRRGRKQWNHQFILPDGNQPKSPPASPNSSILPTYGASGEELFDVLFGSNHAYYSNLLSLAFNHNGPAEPTRAALRLHLLLDADMDELALQRWSQLAYQGRRLSELDWTVELCPTRQTPEFPEPVSHTLRFPDRVVMLVGDGYNKASHKQDIDRFFRRHWQGHVPLSQICTVHDFQSALREGTPRLVYYYGPADTSGLRLQSEELMDWKTLANLLEATGTVSILYLNMIGDTALDAFPQGRRLLGAIRAAALMQCTGRLSSNKAATAAVSWLRDVLVDAIDPIQALHRHETDGICAWSRYSRWQINEPKVPDDPDFVNLFLDRDKQRKALLGAKSEFYTDNKEGRIHHVIACGKAGNRAWEFPKAVTQYLLDNKNDAEVFFLHQIRLDWVLTTDADAVESAVRRELNWHPGSSLDSALLPDKDFGKDIFCFVILGWELPTPGDDRDRCRTLMEAVTRWCMTRLSDALAEIDNKLNLRIISIVTLELAEKFSETDIEEDLEELQDTFYDNPAFHFGELDVLSGVKKADLRRFFRNEDHCRCSTQQREQFPDLLLGERKEIPFDEAVATIRRGYPYNMGTLFDELSDLKDKGLWPTK